MATATTTISLINTPSITSSQISADNVFNTSLTSLSKSQQIFQKHEIASRQSLRKKSLKIILPSSDDSYTSSQTSSSILSTEQSEILRQRIEHEYDVLQQNEAYHRCYIENPFDIVRAHDQLGSADDGTYFIRPADGDERISNIEYFVHFVVNKKVHEIPICSDKEHRQFWFRSKSGHEADIMQIYSGIDLMLNRKQICHYSEQYNRFQICFKQPIQSTTVPCVLLPEHVRATAGQNTILHELATEGLVQYFNELIRISKKDTHFLRVQVQFILNKINGRDEQGQTPLILAIQAKKYDFVELLIDNKADVNIPDAQGCSPLHHACRQANHKMLKKLILRDADPHYFNRKETTDGTYQSNLSAFHYLAMAKGATTRNIIRCTRYLLKCDSPLMPLTKQGKSPFDIAQMYHNDAYESVKLFCNRYQFNNLLPIEVSSRNDAKMMLTDLACPSLWGRLRLRLKHCNNRDCVGNDGLFLLYKTKKTKNQPDEEYGLCVHYERQVFIYIISQKYISSIFVDSPNSSWESIFTYSLITGTAKDDYAQVILFKSREELIYNYTKYKGILPTTLKDFVRKDNVELTTMKATDLLVPNNQLSISTDVEETQDEDSASDSDVDVKSIDRFDLSQIHSAKLIDENQRRFIWLARVQCDQTGSFSVIIKDYLPHKDIHLYKQYRLDEFSGLPQQQNNNTKEAIQYEFSSRSLVDYNHESKLLLNQLKNHPFIVHTFICDHRPENDLRIFMEYLPCGNLHSYLKQLEHDSPDSLINACHWIYQLAQVMAYLSKQKIVHRDLAARNILLKTDKYIKLSDFGLSRLEGIEPEGKDCFVPSRWAAPECFDRHGALSSSSDVWSFGIVMWEIYAFGATPYEGETNNSSQPLVRLLKRYLVEQNRRLSRPDCCPESMYDLMYRCWNGNINRRLRFVDIINEFNEMSIVKDCIVPFSREERRMWREAKDEYFSINQSSRSLSNSGPEYVKVEDK